MKNNTIGVVGFGHLGSSIVLSLLAGGFPKERLLISHRGSKKTLLHAAERGVSSCITDTGDLMSRADIIILAAKPQDIGSIVSNRVKEGALIISFMAAVSQDTLSRLFDCCVCRAMCSGPETIESGLGVSVLWPYNERAEEVLRAARMKLFDIGFEEELDAFTVGICIPPIIMNITVPDDERKTALSGMELEFPVYAELSGWIETVLSQNGHEKKEDCLKNVSTKGGISEAMTASLCSGADFASALRRGMARCGEILRDINSALLQNVA